MSCSHRLPAEHPRRTLPSTRTAPLPQANRRLAKVCGNADVRPTRIDVEACPLDRVSQLSRRGLAATDLAHAGTLDAMRARFGAAYACVHAEASQHCRRRELFSHRLPLRCARLLLSWGAAPAPFNQPRPAAPAVAGSGRHQRRGAPPLPDAFHPRRSTGMPFRTTSSEGEPSRSPFKAATAALAMPRAGRTAFPVLRPPCAPPVPRGRASCPLSPRSATRRSAPALAHATAAPPCGPRPPRRPGDAR